MFIFAHPDDIEFGVAGSVARWTDEGAEVIYCIVTDGAARVPSRFLAENPPEKRVLSG